MDDNIHFPKNRRSPSTAPNRQRSQPQDINVAGASNIDPERNPSPPNHGNTWKKKKNSNTTRNRM